MKKNFRQIIEQNIIKAKRESCIKDIKAAIEKKAGYNLNWNVIHKAKNSFGEEYKVERISDDQIRMYNEEEDFTGPMGIIVPAFDFFDDNNNLVSKGS